MATIDDPKRRTLRPTGLAGSATTPNPSTAVEQLRRSFAYDPGRARFAKALGEQFPGYARTDRAYGMRPRDMASPEVLSQPETILSRMGAQPGSLAARATEPPRSSTPPNINSTPPTTSGPGATSGAQSLDPDAQASYNAYRSDLRSAIDAQQPGSGFVERGNAGLRALASNPSLVQRLNQQYQTDNIGVQAQVGANGRMQFSDAPTDPNRPTTQRALTSGGNLSESDINATTDRLRQIGMQSTALRDRMNFNRSGALSRRLEPEEQITNMLTSPSRSDRQGALTYRLGQQQDATQQRQLTATERMQQPQYLQSILDLETANRVAGLQRELMATNDPARRREITDLLQSLNGSRGANTQVVYAEEALDPARPEIGTRRVPLILRPDGTGSPVTARGATRSLPQGITRDQAIEAARRAIESGVDPQAVMGRLGEYGLTLEDIQQ